jgi:peptidoglycan/xylan/chitin deacetylase (PgdA/CDA1 family)
MTGRWQWDFEDGHIARRPKQVPPPLPTSPASSPPPPPAPAAAEAPRERLTRFRRRRAAALLGAAVVIALIAAALSGSGHRHAAPASAAEAALAQEARNAPAQPPVEPENGHNAAVSSVLAYTPFVRAGAGRKREVALTFDDGPGPYTAGVLSALERLHARATFFVIGRMERYFSAATLRQISDGDVIGDHTENHPALARLPAHEQREELAEQIARIELLGGKRPVLFRPPYGSFNATTLSELKALHLLMVLWSVDTGDYRQPGVAAIVERALAGAHPGAIILMHDAGGVRTQTIAALPAIINGLRARGYRIVTVPQLLRDDPPPAGQPMPTSLSGD